MIATKFLKDIFTVFPNAGISIPALGASFIFDSHGEIIGHIDWRSPVVYLHQGYTHYKPAVDAMNKQGIKWEKVDGELPKQKPEDKDPADVLYGEPDDI